ncbi:MAG: 4Fe-4S dicluster domain-containing protein [Gammaproteobacteria bacterium]|nr:MAG: 4Fe-4S dicluster domain-containing protein [Gammaproteobacteria bacterium]
MQRRNFIKQLAAVSAAVSLSGGAIAASRTQRRFLRPPGALPETDFTAVCIGCGQCGEICPNRCIRYFGMENGLTSLATPYIIPREKGCILCMKCGQVCPSGAIQPIERSVEALTSKVSMGRAVVDRHLCLSWQGKTCGVCYRACPLQDLAIRVQRLEQPIIMDACIGCGLCERSCIQMPQAIRILPDQERTLT